MKLTFLVSPMSPQASIATWLHLKAPLENTEEINKYQLSNIELVLTHTVTELGVLSIARKLLVLFVIVCKKNPQKLKFVAKGLPKT